MAEIAVCGFKRPRDGSIVVIFPGMPLTADDTDKLFTAVWLNDAPVGDGLVLQHGYRQSWFAVDMIVDFLAPWEEWVAASFYDLADPDAPPDMSVNGLYYLLSDLGHTFVDAPLPSYIRECINA